MIIDSSNIKVFPFAKYRDDLTDLGSRLFYENNISQLIKQLIDTEGFIISGSVDTLGNITSSLCFNLYGYYFEVSAGNLVDETAKTDVYAVIEVSGVVPELQGQDDTTKKFTALQFVGTPPKSTETTKHYLRILTKSGNNWILDTNSYVKFNTQSLKIEKIDGKH